MVVQCSGSRAKFSYRALHSAKYTAYPKFTMDLCSHFTGQTTVSNGPPVRNNSVNLLTCSLGGCFEKKYFCSDSYEDQSNSDNGPISQKMLLESELFFTQNVDIGVAYSCLKYGVFITTRFDAMIICIQHCYTTQISIFILFVWMQYVCLDSYISGCLCCLNTPMLNKSNYTINTNLVVWNIYGC